MASESPADDRLALYTMAMCPFGWRVNRTIKRLGLEVETRDILLHPSLREELIQATGRATVPVLWIQSADGSVRWMPESMDIIHYLERVYG
jgi:glutaredoxin